MTLDGVRPRLRQRRRSSASSFGGERIASRGTTLAGEDFIDPREPDKLVYPMRVVAQDQTATDTDGDPLLATVYVPSNRFQPGPRTHRFHVIDYDASAGKLRPPARVKFPPSAPDASADRKTWGYIDHFTGQTMSAEDLAVDNARGRRFRCQNVYAISARTLAKFESSLGRRVPWGFGSHELYLVPHAFAEANAYYSRDDNALLFGYVDADGERIYTALSHDVVAHETTHAILDGLRRGYMEPGLPDQGGFHEAFADIVALLSVFSIENLVAKLLGEADKEGEIEVRFLTRETLQSDNPLFGLAEQLGDFLGVERGNGLRRSVALPANEDWKTNPAFREEHRRGEVLVAAIMRTMLDIWIGRLEAFTRGRSKADRNRVAEEGAKSAGHLLRMAIRAIDYLPPVEFEFPDFVAAVVKSDREVAPMDDYGYRKTVVDQFDAYGIVAQPDQIIDLSERSPIYSGLNFTAMQDQRDEVYRFIWSNADFLGIETDVYLNVDEVVASTRVGPDGLVVRESIATYVQQTEAPAAHIAALSAGADGRPRLRIPQGIESVPLKILGGGTLIFDQFGRLKFHHPKPIFDWDRQQRRLDHLVKTGVQDTRGRFGFSRGAARGQEFVALHKSKDRAGEDW